MESKLYKKANKEFKVFPRVFKKIGVALVSASALSTILCIVYQHVFTKQSWHWTGMALVDVFIVGLLFFSLSAEEIEDERVELIRLRVLSSSVVFIVVIVVLKPLLYPLFDVLFPHEVASGEDIPALNAQELIIEMLLIYNMMFYYLKRKA